MTKKTIIGDVDIKMLYLKQLPEILHNLYVYDDFVCSYNKLINLKNSPEFVGGDFRCDYNKLTSLEGAPKTVGGNFYCGTNSVKFTEAQVRAVCNVKGNVYVK